ncbi:MAG TPA: hypothetical protein VMH06_07135, partial [Thermodesulfovibrionales bacterium]|nr:hypothetical protein [Thermodesulfovibrionales bacterium]
MEREHAVCSLDYLTGTLATAYKGMITALVAKDFCIMEDDTAVVLRGTILSMPEGEYHASLMREGRELARAALSRGLFEFEVPQDALRGTTNLQIDVIQRGRHIGTFLLTREKADGFFASAQELSREVAGIDFRQRTALLAEKPGLLQSAEKIISKIFSTKKDWTTLSDDLNSFSKDLFWFARDAFYGWYDLIVRFEARACEKVDVRERDKPLANLLSAIELPLEHEEDHERLRTLLEIWLEGVKTSSVSLSSRIPHVLKVLALIGERFPDADLGPLQGLLIASLKNRAMKTPALPERVLKALSVVMGSDDLAALEPYREERKEELILNVSAAEAAEGERSPDALLKRIGTIALSLPDDAAMIERFFSAAGKNLTAASAPALGAAVIEMFSLFPELSPDA